MRPNDRRLGLPLLAAGILLSGLLVLGNLNPMLLGFQAELRLFNDSGEKVFVTALGRSEGSGELVPVPGYALAVPALPAVHAADLPLPPAGSLAICYGSDDFVASLLAVRGAEGGWRQLTLDRGADLVVVPPLAELPAAAPDVPGIVRQHRTHLRALACWLPLLGPALLLAGVLRCLREWSRRAQESGPKGTSGSSP